VPFYAYVHRGYWIDIGTPEKYLKVHRDILSGVLAFEGFHPNAGGTYVDPAATVEPGARLTGPAYVGAGSIVKARAVVEPYAVVGANCRIEEGACVGDSVLWANVRIGQEAQVRGALIGRSAHIGHHAFVDRGVVLGDKSVITDYSRITPSGQE
jgi:NDP-sugar pyrophosphorylase family protein